MSYIVQLRDIPFLALTSAAEHVRIKHNLERRHMLTDLFENEFNVKIHTDRFILDMNTDIEFVSKEEYAWFLLRWA